MRGRYLPGDVVARRKGLAVHKGIALGDGRVLHNLPFRGEHICSEEEFRAGRRLRVTAMPYDAREQALRHAEEASTRGRRYNLFTNNCEHTVTRAASGTPTSTQLRGVIAGLVVGGVALALTRHPAIAAVGYAAAHRWVARLSSR